MLQLQAIELYQALNTRDDDCRMYIQRTSITETPPILQTRFHEIKNKKFFLILRLFAFKFSVISCL